MHIGNAAETCNRVSAGAHADSPVLGCLCGRRAAAGGGAGGLGSHAQAADLRLRLLCCPGTALACWNAACILRKRWLNNAACLCIQHEDARPRQGPAWVLMSVLDCQLLGLVMQLSSILGMFNAVVCELLNRCSRCCWPRSCRPTFTSGRILTRSRTPSTR